MNRECRWNDTDRGKPNRSETNMSHCHIVHHKSHTDWRGIEPRSPASEVKFRIADISLVSRRVLWLKSFSIDSWIQTGFKTETLKISVPITRRTYHRMKPSFRFFSEESTASHFLVWKGSAVEWNYSEDGRRFLRNACTCLAMYPASRSWRP